MAQPEKPPIPIVPIVPGQQSDPVEDRRAYSGFKFEFPWGSREEANIATALLRYKDLLRTAHPKIHPDKGVLPLTERERATLSESLGEARQISARLRTYDASLFSDNDADFVQTSAELFPPDEAPFRTNTLRRDKRVADIDFRYGRGDLLESKKRGGALEILVNIGAGRILGREDMRGQETPIRSVVSLLKENGEDQDVFLALKRIVQGRERALGESISPDQRARESAALNAAVEELADIKLLTATEFILSVVNYAFTEGLPDLRSVAIATLAASVVDNEQIKTLRGSTAALHDFSYLINGLIGVLSGGDEDMRGTERELQELYKIKNVL